MVITALSNIETSSVCNKKCIYCPSSKVHLHRKTGLMSMETFEKTLFWIKYYDKKGTQTDINLHAMGEPLLNPHIVDMVKITRKALPKVVIRLCTNGILLNEEMGQALKDAGISFIDITDHDAKDSVKANIVCKKLVIDGMVTREFVRNPHDWAGQIDWQKSFYRTSCEALAIGSATVLWNGDITECCMDAFGKGVIGNVKDNIRNLELTKFSVCDKCHHS